MQADEDYARSQDKDADQAPKGPMIDLMYELQGEKIRMSEEEVDDNR